MCVFVWRGACRVAALEMVIGGGMVLRRSERCAGEWGSLPVVSTVPAFVAVVWDLGDGKGMPATSG